MACLIYKVNVLDSSGLGSVFNQISKEYRRDLSTYLSPGDAGFIIDYIVPYIMKILEEGVNESMVHGDFISTAEGFSSVLVDSGLVEIVSFSKRGDGYICRAKDCIFSSQSHRILPSEDVHCPISYLLSHLYHKATGRRLRRLSPSSVQGMSSSIYWMDEGCLLELIPGFTGNLYKKLFYRLFVI
jgi:hypothetical protein